MKTVTVIIPVYNEAESLPILFSRLDQLSADNTKFIFEFIYVNDGSTDESLNIIAAEADKNSRVGFINLSRNFGKEIAMVAGLDHANGDAVAIIDADLQDPPELIPTMLELWSQGYDDVYAKRRSRRGESFLKRKTSQWYYRLLQRTTHIQIQRDTGDFRLMSRRFVRALREFRESQRYTKGMFSLVGFKKKELLYDRDPRAAGKTKWNYSKLFNLAVDGITSFTTAPLRIASLLGSVVSLFAFIYILYLLIRPLFGVSTGDGYSSIMAAVLFIGGVQLLSLGIIGEYIGRIFNEVKQRPLYIVEHHRAPSISKTHR